MRYFLALLVTLLALSGVPATSFANFLVPQSLEEKVRRSDEIIVGKVETITTVEDYRQYAVVSVKSVIKGEAFDTVKVWLVSSIPEANVHSCQTGKSYVFFLVKTLDGNYKSTNGRYGVVAIKD